MPGITVLYRRGKVRGIEPLQPEPGNESTLHRASMWWRHCVPPAEAQGERERRKPGLSSRKIGVDKRFSDQVKGGQKKALGDTPAC